MTHACVAVALLFLAASTTGCGAMSTATSSRDAGLPAGSATTDPAGGGPLPTKVAASPRAPTVAAENPCGAERTLGPDGEVALDAGTYAWLRPRPGVEFPAICLTVPVGWMSDGRFTYRARDGQEVPPVAVMFWDVGSVYAHPCRWRGTLFDPGPTVDDLADALAEIPLRSATAPTAVSLDGYRGKYLQWSVPADIETDAQGAFVTCHTDPGDDRHYFESWTGDPKGWDGDRYQQGPGQLDRLWILDVDGVRLVIDAFSTPTATEGEIDELLGIVNSVTFER